MKYTNDFMAVKPQDILLEKKVTIEVNLATALVIANFMETSSYDEFSRCQSSGVETASFKIALDSMEYTDNNYGRKGWEALQGDILSFINV